MSGCGGVGHRHDKVETKRSRGYSSSLEVITLLPLHCSLTGLLNRPIFGSHVYCMLSFAKSIILYSIDSRYIPPTHGMVYVACKLMAINLYSSRYIPPTHGMVYAACKLVPILFFIKNRLLELAPEMRNASSETLTLNMARVRVKVQSLSCMAVVV